MTYTYQLFGAVTGWSFLYGCMLGMASPATYDPKHPKMGSAGDNEGFPIDGGHQALHLYSEGHG